MTTNARPNTNSNTAGNTTTEKPAPYNLEVEASLLGAALLSPEALEVMATKVVPSDFYKPSHALIAAAMIRAFETDQPADPVTIADTLEREGKLAEIGGTPTLITLQADSPSTQNAGRYAEIVHNDATLRRIMAAASKASELALSRPEDVHGAVEKAQTLFAEVASQNGARTYSSLDMPNMGELLRGEVIQEQMTILARKDGQCLFYAGKMHVLQAEPSSGKSWIALAAALEVLNMGGSVVYLDYEDTSTGIKNRLLALGAEPVGVEDRFQYVSPREGIGLPEKAELTVLFKKLNPDLIIIDGVAEAISRDGFDEDKNSEVVKWVNQFPRWVTQQTGACVVMIDHIAKDKDKGGRYARGAGHKLAAVDGASYQIKIIESFSRHKAGSVKLVVAKDRPGVFSIGETAAIVSIDPSGDGTIVRMKVEKSAEHQVDDAWRPTKLMEKLSLELERAGHPLQEKALVRMVGGKKTGEALARLISDNYVMTFKIGSSEMVRSVKPYREGDTPLPPATEQLPLLTGGEPAKPDELAAKRAERKAKNEHHNDPTDPGPTEPLD